MTMTPNEFNEKAREYLSTHARKWPAHPLEDMADAMLLLHTVADREKAVATTRYDPWGNAHFVHMAGTKTLASRYDKTLPRAVCRYVAAWLGWGEIEEAPSGQP